MNYRTQRLRNYLIVATQIVLLLSSAIWTRTFIWNIAIAYPSPEISLGYAITGCISSILFFVTIVWIFAARPDLSKDLFSHPPGGTK